eukprot:CAMPEP_0201515170 /NCGR_PEP_ID=MMETSP0161_2-20130828/6819_1 /ASSEMBLY_ACC=CAM_ASM_000251 /TAXON_ID=180227 /ORGANISM="Neoparamoeba aestuarina, Strain SoJaBio B1-5/56/2" /LENGTH=118 /DNA_ID=CAMNT_0047911929 /DNA_START=111 /DNA_END=464 /DNA_ORIENTATION=+
MLASNVPNVKVRFPLALQPDKIEIEDNEMEAEFLVHMIPKLNYEVLRKAASVCQYNELPETAPENPENDVEFLQKLHHVLVNINVVEGKLRCQESGREYPITNGIPNMLLYDYEIAEE